MSAEDIKQLYSIPDVCARWGDISLYTVRRRISQGEIKTINIGARVFIPLSEILRIEQFGVGTPRKVTRERTA